MSAERYGWPCTQTASCPLSVSWGMSNAALPAAHPCDRPSRCVVVQQREQRHLPLRREAGFRLFEDKQHLPIGIDPGRQQRQHPFPRLCSSAMRHSPVAGMAATGARLPRRTGRRPGTSPWAGAVRRSSLQPRRRWPCPRTRPRSRRNCGHRGAGCRCWWRSPPAASSCPSRSAPPGGSAGCEARYRPDHVTGRRPSK